MSELISREEAIALFKEFEPYMIVKASEYEDALCHLPYIETIRPNGKWLPHPTEREWDVCSACGIGCKRREYEIQFGQERMTEHSYQYCPHCGAKMHE